MWIISIFIIIIATIIFFIIKSEKKHQKEQLKYLISEKKELIQKIEEQKKEVNELNKEIDNLKCRKVVAEFELQDKCQQYTDALQEYQDNAIKDFNIFKESIQYQKEELLKELQKMDQTYQSRVAARVREEEVKQKKDFYCLHLSSDELQDISVLNTIKPKLKNPRILSMLIWSTYYQKKMTTLCNNVTGITPITGIYKITNQLNQQCYIGQARDISKRFKEHAKCGLGIDTPQNNKLYKAMLEDGLENFSWEVLEKCPIDQLNEKETYYISAYQSYNFGYNSNSGIKKE